MNYASHEIDSAKQRQQVFFHDISDNSFGYPGGRIDDEMTSLRLCL